MGTEQATVGTAILGRMGGSTVRHWGLTSVTPLP